MKIEYHKGALILFLLLSLPAFTQIYNQEVEALLDITSNNEFIDITGVAYNKTELTQSFRYELSVIRHSADGGNQSKNSQGGRKVLEPLQRIQLSNTTINVEDQDRIIVLLLLYDVNNKIIGNARWVHNDDRSEEEIAQEMAAALENQTEYQSDLGTESYDGLELTGIVIEQTKTKPGRDFYQLFYSSYLANNINGNKIVTISEVLTMGSNTKIQIKIEDDLVFEFFVRPHQDYIRGMSDVALRRVSSYFERLKREANLIRRY